MPANKQILCLSDVPWGNKTNRRQVIMSKMLDCEIIFINPPVFELKDLLKRKTPEALHPYPNISVYSPTVYLPLGNRLPEQAKIVERRGLLKFIISVLDKHEFASPVVWSYSPLYSDIIKQIPSEGIVYDCIENHVVLGGKKNPNYTFKKEKELCSFSNAVFTSYQYLYDKLARYNKNTYLIPNGIDYKFYNKASSLPATPVEMMEKLKKPVYGFVGNIIMNTDIELMLKITELEGSLVCIGNITQGIDVSEIQSKENVLFIKNFPQSQLNQYMAYFDVCINPLKAGGNSADISIKPFLEYLATGKPVVTSRRPTLVSEYSDAVDIADTAEQFLEFCRTAVLRHGPAVTERQLAYARECEWDARISEIRRLLARNKLLVD